MGNMFFRYIKTLQLIPPYPRHITTTDILNHLSNEGIDITVRSLQRDLNEKLSLHFPIICDTTQKPYRWSMDKHYQLGIACTSIHCNTYKENKGT
jgi:hypothetical protein